MSRAYGMATGGRPPGAGPGRPVYGDAVGRKLIVGLVVGVAVAAAARVHRLIKPVPS